MKKPIALILALSLSAAYGQSISPPSAVSSVTGSCGVTVSPTTGAPVVSAPVSDVAVSTTTDTIANTQCNTTRRYTNAAAVTVTVPSPSGFPAGFVVTVKSDGANTAGITITPSTTIDGSASNITLTTDQSIDLYLNASSLWTTLSKPSAGGSTSFANPTATAGPTANNGTATTAMRSDASPAVQVGSASQQGIVEVDNTTIKASAGVISAQATTINGTTCTPGGSCSPSASGLVNTHPGYVASIWYFPIWDQNTGTGSGTPALTTAYCSIGQIGGNSTATITALGTKFTTPGSSNVQLALYANDTTVSPNRPGALVDSTVNIANSGSTGSGSLNATHSISPGFYWFCLQTADTTVRFQNLSFTSENWSMPFVGDTSVGAVFAGTNVAVSTTTGITSFGTWPVSLHGSTWSAAGASAPAVLFEFSSVP